MKIKNVKINGFGNLREKEINLKSGINIIKGQNESGKSTFLKFIGAILYGANRNKNGKDISDFEKYKPWDGKEYSGKMSYELDSNDTFEVFRDFTKKSPKIYNNKSEDITQNYNFDKNKNSEFFLEQTGIVEEVLFKTAVIEQQEVALNKSEQHILLQKIANKVSTGDDNISFAKALKKIQEKYNEEVGTDRTVAKPLNVVHNEISIINEKLKTINSTQESMTNFDMERDEIVSEIYKIDTKLKLSKEIKQFKEDVMLEEEKINIKKSSLTGNVDKLKEVELKEKKFKDSKVTPNWMIILISFMVLITDEIIFKMFFTQNITLAIASLVTAIAALALLWIQITKWIKQKKASIKNHQGKLSVLKEKEIIEQNIQERKNEIKKAQENLDNIITERNNKIKNQYLQNLGTDEIDECLEKNRNEIVKEIETLENKLNMLRLKKSTLEFDKSNNRKQLNELVTLQENLQNLQEEETEILSTGRSINLAKTAIEEAYEKMKENITPEFTNSLSAVVSRVSDGKYKNIKFSDEEGLVVELENGDYINAGRLSAGTIDQMYLALRLSVLSEICKESIPLILDESFAFYDEDRLRNALNFLNKEYKNHQIIILSCSKREETALNELKIEFNLIEI
ncbi:MAG: AAA family ATPase [Oscillospiraceae bacterium]|nr:AAA family ATPase [Oscillospiraceae bacterium]